MHTQTLLFLYNKDLTKLKEELRLYTTEENIWRTEAGISNSAGNLCLHLLGNLNHFIGAQLGHTGYIRQRDLEFSLKDIAREKLLNDIDNTIAVVHASIQKLTVEDFENEYEQTVVPASVSVEAFLFYLTTHLAYHLGQINYHRRLLDKL